MDIGEEICEYVKINPRVEKKPLVKKICPPIEEELLEGMQLIIRHGGNTVCIRCELTLGASIHDVRRVREGVKKRSKCSDD